MKIGFAHALAFGLLNHLATALQTDAPGSFGAIAVDKAGRILALDSSRDNSLAMCEGGVWREFRVELGKRPASAQALLALQDGRIASLWSL